MKYATADYTITYEFCNKFEHYLEHNQVNTEMTLRPVIKMYSNSSFKGSI